MSVEDRVRRGLHDPVDADEEQFLHAVRQGADARRRRTRRTAVLTGGAVAVAALAVAVGVRASDNGPAHPPSGRTPAPTLPAGAARGVIDVVASSPAEAFQLTTNVGCVACSTVWTQIHGGDWIRLHDFGAEAYVGTPDPTFGPVTNLVMRGPDGWAWGNKLLSTHDGGNTWSEVGQGPGRRTDAGHGVVIAGGYAWSLFSDFDTPTTLYRTPVATDEWTPVALPDGKADDLFGVGDRIVLDVADEGLANRRLRGSTDGVHWSRLAMPCATDGRVLTAASSAFVLCPGAGGGAILYRSRDLGPWRPFGSGVATSDTVFPLGDDRVLLLRNARAALVTATGHRRVDGVPAGGAFEVSSVGELSYLTSFGDDNVGRLLRSTDGGRTWTQLE